MSSVTQQAPATIVRSFYEALGRGDIETVRSLIGTDGTTDMPGDSPLAGLYEGRDAILGFLGRMQEIARGTFRAELRGVYVNRDSVVAIHHGTATAGDKSLAADAALVFTVADGVITSCTVHQARQDEWDDFFS